MSILWSYIVILFFHFCGDFALQSSWMAQGKSKSWQPLLAHVAVYTAMLAVAVSLVWLSGEIGADAIALWLAANSVLHLIADFTTSRIGAVFWRAGRMRAFFLVLGVDQFIHQLCLAVTFILIATSS